MIKTIDEINRIEADRMGIPRRNPYGPCHVIDCNDGFIKSYCIGGGFGDYLCPVCEGHGYIDQLTGKGVHGPERKTKQTKKEMRK